MTSLYELASNYQSISNDILACEEITPEHQELLDEVKDDIQTKAINIGALIKNLEVEELGIKNALSDMTLRYERLQKKNEALKEYLKNQLGFCNIKEVKSPHFDIKIKQNPCAVIIHDETLIPENYFKETVMRRADKTMLSVDLKNNVVVPGVTLERKTRIEIK